MAVKKADLEAHQKKYQDLMAKARLAEREGLHTQAVEFALSSLDYIDGMMQYERRYNEKEFESIRTIEMILKYAPLLLDFPSLGKLEELLKKWRRIERNTSESLGDKLFQGRELMWIAHRLWNHIERNPEARQDELCQCLDGDQDQWRSIAEVWEEMGLLRRTQEERSYRLALTTRMGELVHGKCPSCGETVEAPKGMFLEEMACPECQKDVLFVILPAELCANTKE